MMAPTPKVQLTVRITEERHRKLKRLSAAAGADMGTWLSELIDHLADPAEQPEKKEGSADK